MTAARDIPLTSVHMVTTDGVSVVNLPLLSLPDFAMVGPIRDRRPSGDLLRPDLTGQSETI